MLLRELDAHEDMVKKGGILPTPAEDKPGETDRPSTTDAPDTPEAAATEGDRTGVVALPTADTTDAAEPAPEAPIAAPLPTADKPEPDTTAPKGRKFNPDVKVALRKGANAKAAAPGLEIAGVDGSAIGLPTDFHVTLRVTTPAPALTAGAALRFCVRTEQDCRVFLIAHTSDNQVSLILPNRDEEVDTLVFSSVEGKFPGVGTNAYSLTVEPPFGQESIVLLALGTTAKCDLTKMLSDMAAKEPAGAGDFEQAFLARFREKNPKMAEIPWSSAVLHLITQPGEQTENPAAPAPVDIPETPPGTYFNA